MTSSEAFGVGSIHRQRPPHVILSEAKDLARSSARHFHYSLANRTVDTYFGTGGCIVGGHEMPQPGPRHYFLISRLPTGNLAVCGCRATVADAFK